MPVWGVKKKKGNNQSDGESHSFIHRADGSKHPHLESSLISIKDHWLLIDGHPSTRLEIWRSRHGPLMLSSVALGAREGEYRGHVPASPHSSSHLWFCDPESIECKGRERLQCSSSSCFCQLLLLSPSLLSAVPGTELMSYYPRQVNVRWATFPLPTVCVVSVNTVLPFSSFPPPPPLHHHHHQRQGLPLNLKFVDAL